MEMLPSGLARVCLVNDEAPLFVEIFIANVYKAEALRGCRGSCCAPASGVHQVQQGVFVGSSSSLSDGGRDKNPNHLFVTN
uniref:Uncharacterized protein n=1 Tax=Aegilops tauschii TaxID=37682 RepID=M8BE25_AEGTA